MAATPRWLSLVLIAYAAGYLAFPPTVSLIVDESAYVTQALAFSRGALTMEGAAPTFPATGLRVASNYPPGTALLQTPFVAAGGWRAAGLASVLGLAAAVLLTAAWLRRAGHEPAFALVIPAFFGALFFGRVAMSDVPTAAMVALTLLLLWKPSGTHWRWSILAGLSAALTLLFREPVAVLLVPFLLGAIIRRRSWSHAAALCMGGLAGIAARMALSHWMFGDPLYVRDSGYGFGAASVATNLPQYAVILLLMFPLGAILPALYRGPRRPEVVSAFLSYFAIFLFYEYDSMRENGPLKGLILTSRFMVPVLPVLALMAADVYPRMVERLGEPFRRAVAGMLPVGLATLVAVAFGIHPAVRRAEGVPRSIVAAIQENTAANVPLVTNHDATFKYLRPMYGPRRLILRSFIGPDQVPRFLREAGGRLSLVFLDRTDSERFLEDSRENERFLAALEGQCDLGTTYDARHGPVMRLRVIEVRHCN